MKPLFPRSPRLLCQAHALQNIRDYLAHRPAESSHLVAGVIAGRGGGKMGSIPLFHTVQEAQEALGPVDGTVILEAPCAVSAAIREAVDGKIPTVVVLSGEVPLHEMIALRPLLQNSSDSLVIGPSSPGVGVPGRVAIGWAPPGGWVPGPVGILSRSTTLALLFAEELAQQGVGISLCIGMGSEPVVGAGFADLLPYYVADPATKVILLIGEIGGYEEERAAHWLAAQRKTPCLAYVAGRCAPLLTPVGHMSALLTSMGGDRAGKMRSLQASGVQVLEDPTQVTAALVAALQKQENP